MVLVVHVVPKDARNWYEGRLRVYGVLWRRLLGTQRDRVSMVTSTRADNSSNFSAPLLEALTLVLVLVGMSKSSSCGALVSEGTFGLGKSVKLGVSEGNEQGEEGRNVLHVSPLRLLVEVLGEFSPLNAIDLHHLTLLKLLKEHLDVRRLCVVHDLVVRSEFVPLLGDLVGPFFKGFHRRRSGHAGKGLELFLEGLLDIDGRLIVSGHVVVMESFEKFRPNAVWITVIILDRRIWRWVYVLHSPQDKGLERYREAGREGRSDTPGPGACEVMS